jgi:hypothetical protein
MPEAHDLQAIVPSVYAVDDAIRAENNFAQFWASKLWDHATPLWKSR